MKTTTRTGANHPLHLICTLATCGLWSPVWIVCAIVGRKTVTDVDLEAARALAFIQGRPAPAPLYSCEACWHYRLPQHAPGKCPYTVPQQRRG